MDKGKDGRSRSGAVGDARIPNPPSPADIQYSY